MQIELIGCTGAGKSTLRQGLIQFCRAQGIQAYEGEELVLARMGLAWVRGYLARTFLIDLLALSMCLKTWRKNHTFYALICKIIFDLPASVSFFQKANILRNSLKKVGVYEFIDRLDSGDLLTFLDEGTLHTVHYLFVHIGAEVPDSDLATFVSVVPLPDVVVYLRQDRDTLIERTLKRGHKRIPKGSYQLAERFILQAVRIFDQLVEFHPIADRLFVIDHGQHITTTVETLDAQMAKFIAELLQSGLDSAKAKLAIQP